MQMSSSKFQKNINRVKTKIHPTTELKILHVYFSFNGNKRSRSFGCSTDVRNGVMKYVRAFQEDYQIYIKKYAYCLGNHVANNDNCYLGFVQPDGQNKCLHKLGPMFSSDLNIG